MSIKYSLLALMADGPISASQMHQKFQTETEGVWPLNIGQVTQTLARLERDELIEVVGETVGANGHVTSTYQATEKGRELLAGWWSDPLARPKSERDELVIKVALASLNPQIDLIALLDRQRRASIAQLRELNTLSRSVPAQRSAQRLNLERRIFELESEARWLDRVEALSALPAVHNTNVHADPAPTPTRVSPDKEA